MNRRVWILSAGLVFVLAWIVGLVLGADSPGPAASNADLVAYYRAHQQSQIVQSYLIDGIAGIALIVFASVLRSVFRQSDRDVSALSSIVFGAGVAAGAISLVQAAFGEALANPDVLSGDGAAVRMSFVLLNAADTFKMLSLALMSLAASVLILGTRSLPRWLGWLGPVLSLTLFVGGLSFVLSSAALYAVLYVALPLLLIWVAGCAVAVWRRSDERPSDVTGQEIEGEATTRRRAA